MSLEFALVEEIDRLKERVAELESGFRIEKVGLIVILESQLRSLFEERDHAQRQVDELQGEMTKLVEQRQAIKDPKRIEAARRRILGLLVGNEDREIDVILRELVDA